MGCPDCRFGVDDHWGFMAAKAHQQLVHQPLHHRVQFPEELLLRPLAFALARLSDGFHHPLAVGGQAEVPVAGDRFLGNELTAPAQIFRCQQGESRAIGMELGQDQIAA